MLSFISHDVTQAFFQPLTTTDFLDDVVVFGEPSSRGVGNGNTDANARNRRQGQGKVVAAVDATVLAIEAEAEVESKWTFIS